MEWINSTYFHYMFIQYTIEVVLFNFTNIYVIRTVPFYQVTRKKIRNGIKMCTFVSLFKHNSQKECRGKDCCLSCKIPGSGGMLSHAIIRHMPIPRVNNYLKLPVLAYICLVISMQIYLNCYFEYFGIPFYYRGITPLVTDRVLVGHP